MKCKTEICSNPVKFSNQEMKNHEINMTSLNSKFINNSLQSADSFEKLMPKNDN